MDITIGIPKRLGYLPLVIDVLRRTGILDIRANRVKILAWDQSGFWLCAKRLEQGRFAIPVETMGPHRSGTAALSPAEVHLLLEGINVHRATYHAHYHRPDVRRDEQQVTGPTASAKT